jgi:hypothetical protein
VKLTQNNVGLGIAAVAVLLMGSAAIADNMGRMGHGMEMGMGMSGPMMAPHGFDFDAVDADKDGKITEAEITAWRAAQIAGVDVNADGKLSVDELAAMHLKRMTEAAQTMAQSMVDRMDTDGDAMLSAAEMLAPPVPARLFDRLDTNEDGAIDKAEADAARQAMRGQMRGDRDGRGGDRGGWHHQMPGMNGNGGN